MENLEKVVKELNNRITELERKVAFLLNEKIINKKEPENKVRDKTKYLFSGSILAKNQLVLSVVKAYVQKHSNLSYEELGKVFHKSLQGSLGVIVKYEEVKSKLDAKKRFFMNDVITLKNEKIVVCTQWGAFNINKFILRASELGFTIKEV